MARGTQGFPRHVRLTDPERYQEIFKAGTKARHPLMAVMALAGGLDHPRLGLAVSRKVSRKAVVRNRIKRRIREHFRRAQAGLRPLDFVVVAYPDAARADPVAFTEALESLSHKISRLCAKP
ncbi:ribonuclease P protein component [Acidiferrobacter sp.]|uniref:ribonuclease P protein component n=1 Tax=Acidiferrobacter sp. TaxID=1872107 RepID=UPI002622EA8E|nr:ribonuclease P protein component [Acidiferrobacter sp.]